MDQYLMNEVKPFILAISDGKAGHETQTQGLVQLLNASNEFEVKWITIKLPDKWLYRYLRFLLKFSCNTAWLKYFITQEEWSRLHNRTIRYIVSSGGNTLVVNALLKQYFCEQNKTQNIVASSLHGIPARLFDVVFTIHKEQKQFPHYVYYPIAPNKMTALPLTQTQSRQHLGIEENEQVITVLLGADTKTVKIGSVEKWGQALLEIRAQYPQARILLSSSRRTPIVFEKSLEQVLQQANIIHKNDQFIWVAQGQSCDVKDFIKAADWVLASPDSTSMVAEVIMAEQNLIVMEAESISDADIQQQLDFLQQQKQLILWHLASPVVLRDLLKQLDLKSHTQLFSQILKNGLK